jgi:hypothetical protein
MPQAGDQQSQGIFTSRQLTDIPADDFLGIEVLISPLSQKLPLLRLSSIAIEKENPS